MTKILKKEIELALHPTAPIMLGLSAMVLIPNYPYTVIFFYTTLALFFMCMSGRENHDIPYTMMLPIQKSDIVRGRILFAVLLEGCQLLLTGGFSLLRRVILPAENAAGMEANLALLAMGLVIYAVFNLVFFPAYYCNPAKIGVPFVLSGMVTFAVISVVETCTHVVPFFRDVLDTPDFDFMTEKLLVFAVCTIIYAVCTLLSLRISVKSFEKIDIS